MAKLNVKKVRTALGKGPVAGAARPVGRTYEGGAGYGRDLKSELFLLAVTNMVGEQTFYESAGDRDNRYAQLVRAAAVEDPDWTARFLGWLRGGANLRTASIVGAAEFVRGRLDAAAVSDGENRRVVASVLQRADEPGELLAYWISRYGRAIPKPIKRGVADAVQRLYTERNLLKYDTAGHAFRFGDVLDLTHPAPAAAWQGDLFAYALGRRHNRADLAVPESLRMVAANGHLRAAGPQALFDTDRLKAAGFTWEDALSLAGSRVDKAKLWECVAEGSPIWLPDGRIVPVEQVVNEQLPVLSYDQPWDMREPVMGRPYPPRDHSIGNLVPAEPVEWIDSGDREVFDVRLASGRVIQATRGHRWAVRTRDGSRRPLWRTTEQMQAGWSVPVALDAGRFGTLGEELDGWFVGSMLGDGSLTGRTPTWTGQDDGTLAAVREYAAKRGCSVNVEEQPGCVRARIVDPAWHQNAVRDELIAHGIWGLRVERKAMSSLPYSRAFILGALAGLIDSDGSVGPSGVEFAVISEKLARQFADMLLRVGVLSVLDTRPQAWRGSYPLWRVRVSDVASWHQLADLVTLRSERKAKSLAALVGTTKKSRRGASGHRGYPGTITWDRIVSVTPAGRTRTFCVRVEPSNLWIVNGVVTGNCLIPSMGYMAHLRNLRNFDQAGVSDEVAGAVAARLADPDEVARSRQLPMRFLSAYRAAPSLRWAYALETALTLSLRNIPVLPGRTLILIDTSGSMNSGFSRDGSLMRWDAAVVFGVALAARCAAAKIVSFSDRTTVFELRKGESVLRAIERFRTDGHFHNGGTYTATAVRKHHAGHDRIVILTDEQASYDGSVSDAAPASVPIFTWNLAGYRLGHTPATGNRWTFGGLSDAGFGMIPLLESGRDGRWPF